MIKLYFYINTHGGTFTQIVEAINVGTIGYIARSSQAYYFHPQNQDGYKIIAKNICKMKKCRGMKRRYIQVITATLDYKQLS